MLKVTLALLCFFILNVARAEDISRSCETEINNGDKICLRYYPGRAVEITRKDGSSKVEYRLSGKNAVTDYKADKIVTVTYEYDPAETGKQFVMTTRITEEARYPGDGESEIVSLSGETPGKHSEKFMAKPKK